MSFLRTAFLGAAVTTLALLCGNARAIEPAPDGAWIPSAEFQLEGADFAQTMHWVSGWSYALTTVSLEQSGSGAVRLFCPPASGLVESRVLLTILNEQFKGRLITSEQAAFALWRGIRERYPCDPAGGG